VDELLSQPIQVCSSALRATTKTTSFRHNDTGGAPSLDGADIIGVESKNYPSEAKKPMWGIENPGQGWNVPDIQLLWGLIESTKFYLGNNFGLSRARAFTCPRSWLIAMGLEQDLDLVTQW
jgi:hypothetical protein